MVLLRGTAGAFIPRKRHVLCSACLLIGPPNDVRFGRLVFAHKMVLSSLGLKSKNTALLVSGDWDVAFACPRYCGLAYHQLANPVDCFFLFLVRNGFTQAPVIYCLLQWSWEFYQFVFDVSRSLMR